MESKKKCSSLDTDTTSNMRAKTTEDTRSRKTGKHQSLECRAEKPGLLERGGQIWKQKLAKTDSSSRKLSRKIGIFKEKCLEMPDDDSVEFAAASEIEQQEQGDFLGERRGRDKPPTEVQKD